MDEITPSLTELHVKNNFETKGVHPPAKKINPIAEKYFGVLPPNVAAYSNVDVSSLRRDPEPTEPSEIMEFGDDQLVSHPSTPGQRQPSVCTSDDGTIYAVWGEETSGGNAIMFSKSTDNGVTWTEKVVVDDVGTNFYPRIACYGTGRYTRLHVVYAYMNVHIYDVYDTSGTYMGTDTSYESDVYYARSNNGGDSWGGYLTIANRDINLIIMQWDYDESMPDVKCDADNNVMVTYHTQADEGHIMSLSLLIIYIILFEGLPPTWFDYSWYKVCFKVSTSGGGAFSGQENVVNDWFLDRSRAALGLTGSGTDALAFVPYSCTGVLSLASSGVEIRSVTNPFFGESVSGDDFVGDGYVVPGGCVVDYLGNPMVGVTDAWSAGDYDVYFFSSTDGGSSFIEHIIDFSTADCFEPRLGVDLANNPFLTWTDGTSGEYDIKCVWSEDGGVTLRDDIYTVNQDHGTANQWWPDIGMFLSDSTRRLDVCWWDERSDVNGDIYYNNGIWWRTNLYITLHDSLANPMGGTVTVTYRSFGVIIERELTPGYWIIYHDPETEITLDRLSSGSTASERWIYDETEEYAFDPPEPGLTDTVVYWNQYYTTFTAESGNPPACGMEMPTGVTFQYEYFGMLEIESTIHEHWADYRSPWIYPETYPPGYTDTRWYCPEREGIITDFTVSPVYYYQFTAEFVKPNMLNDECCEGDTPEFELIERYFAGENVGGTTPIRDWTDCGSYYEYENPHNASSTERYHIPSSSDSSGVVTGFGPYEPGAYKQWKPTVNLIVAPPEDNTVWTTIRWLDGEERLLSGLRGVFSEWVDCGSDLEFSQFTTYGHVATTPRLFECINSAFTGMVQYGDVVFVTLENDFGYGFIISDGDTHSSPYVSGWVPSESYEICAISPQVFDMTRFVFDSWDHGGGICNSVVPISDTVFTANFNKEYMLELVSDHGTTYGGGWYAEGATATFGVNSIEEPGGGIRYVFLGWTGSGTGSYTGTDSSATVTMNNPIIEEAEWQTEYYLGMDYTGCSGVPTLEGEDWYESGTFPAIGTDSIIGGTGEHDSSRCLFDHWESDPPGASFGNPNKAHTSLMMDRPYDITAVYKPQHKLWISHNPDTITSPATPAVGVHWVTEGDTVNATTESPWGTNYCVGYMAEGSISDDIYSRVEFEFTEPTSIEWQWGDMLTLSVHDTTSTDFILTMGGAVPTPGDHSYIPGDEVTATCGTEYVTLYDGMRLHCIGWRGTGSVPDSGTGTVVVFDITENSTITWLYQPEYRLTVDDYIYSSPSTHPHYDSPDPTFGEHWYPEGTEITATIDESVYDGGITYVNVGFTGSGSVPSVGWGASVTFTISNPSELNWRWENEAMTYRLVIVSDHGTCSPPVGTNYFPTGVDISCFTEAYATAPSGDTRYRCTGWTSTIAEITDGFTYYTPMFTTGSPGEIDTLEWNWANEYKLTIISEYGDSIMPNVGEYWYMEGTMIHAYNAAPIDTIVPPDSMMFCTGFHPDGHSLDGIDTTSLDFTFELNDPSTIEWKWTGYRIPVIVISEWGDPSPADTTLWLPGSEVTALVTSPHTSGLLEGERYRCTGWTATGSAPGSGTGTSMSFTVEDTTIITWNWDHQYRLDIISWPEEYGSPVPPIGGHWHNVGATVTGRVTVPDDTMYCVGFEGTGSAPSISPYTTFEFDLDEPSSVTWLWYGEGSVAELNVRSSYGDPEPHGRTWWLLGSEVDADVDSAVVVGSRVYTCTGWRGAGSVSEFGDSNHIVFNIDEDTNIEWQWGEIFSFEVRNPGGYGDPDPVAGVYYNPYGTYVSGEMDDHPYWTGTDTMYCVGYIGDGDLPSVDPHTEFEFTQTMPTEIEWQWSDEAFRLEVSSYYGSPYPHGTTYWIPGARVEATVDEYVDIGDGIRAYCTGYTGTGSAPASGVGNYTTFRMESNSTLNWEWGMRYSLTIINPEGWGSPIPDHGNHWFPESTTVEGEIMENPSGPADTMYCIGYYGGGDLPEVSPQVDFSFTISQPCTVEWRWAGEGSVVSLEVTSAHDHPHPYGLTYWLIGSDVEAYVDSIAYSGYDSSAVFVCDGFELTHGTADTSDSTNEVDWVIEYDSELVWKWTGQVYITLDYDGCPVEPELLGEGWYDIDDTIEISAETPVYDAGDYYGFVEWTTESSTEIMETRFSTTDIVVSEPCTLTANYSTAYQVAIEKDPERNEDGYIQVDHEIYDSTSIVTDWWGIGSEHYIKVPTRDSTGVVDTLGEIMVTERFNFNHWSDEGDSAHWVSPTGDTTFTAFYDAQIMCVITKVPPHRTGWFEIDGETHEGVSSVIKWWDPGSEHAIEVSREDYCDAPECDTMRFFFREWSDGGDIRHVTDTITETTVFTAYYDSKIRVRMMKEPPHNGGAFHFNDSIVYDEDTVDFWVDAEEIVSLGATEYDLDMVADPDSVYKFLYWDDGSPRMHDEGPIERHVEKTAMYDSDQALLSFEVTVDGDPDSIWQLDTVEIVNTVTMETEDMFHIQNTGNVPLDFGLAVVGVTDHMWTPGHASEDNRFVLRARFNDDTSPPTVFSMSRDYIRDAVSWASEGVSGTFGPGGVNVRPSEDYGPPESTENLWMQFIAPSLSDAYDIEMQIIVYMQSRYYLP